MEIERAIEIIENYAPDRDSCWYEMREALMTVLAVLERQTEPCECEAPKSCQNDSNSDNIYFKAISVLGCENGGISRRERCRHNCCDGENCVTWMEKLFRDAAAWNTRAEPEPIKDKARIYNLVKSLACEIKQLNILRLAESTIPSATGLRQIEAEYTIRLELARQILELNAEPGKDGE